MCSSEEEHSVYRRTIMEPVGVHRQDPYVYLVHQGFHMAQVHREARLHALVLLLTGVREGTILGLRAGQDVAS